MNNSDTRSNKMTNFGNPGRVENKENFSILMKLNTLKRNEMIQNNNILKCHWMQRHAQNQNSNFNSNIDGNQQNGLKNISHTIVSICKKKKPIIKLKQTIQIHPGNFCYPLKRNYRANHAKTTEPGFFFRYFGEDKIDLVNNKCVDLFNQQLNGKNEEMPDTDENLPDDLTTNLIFNEILKETEIQRHSKQRQRGLLKIFYQKFTSKFPYLIKICQKSFEKRVQTLFNRNSVKSNHKEIHFFHQSCGMNEDKVFINIVGTYKVMYCSICYKFDCHIHGTKADKDFNNPQCYDIKDYLKTYRDMHDLSYQSMTKREKNEKKYENRILESCEEYNKLISVLKLQHIAREINFSSDVVRISLDNAPCSKYCYKIFMTIGDSAKNRIYTTHSIEFPEIYEMYLDKLFQIFKYDPCTIHKCLKMITLPRPFVLECTSIYLRLLSSVFSISKIVTKETVRNCGKCSTNKQKCIPIKSVRKIKDNAQNHIIVPYEPCCHPGNITCGNDCPCSERGLCEKYCACNKDTCKLKFRGCACKSSCSKVVCPCFASGRECDMDLCKNCIHDNLSADLPSCKNNQLSRFSYPMKVSIASSGVIGWGLYATEDIPANDMIAEYVGEVIDNDEISSREMWNDIENMTYMFTLNDEYTIDSKMMGNIPRFANHSKKWANSYTKVVFSEGNHRICLYALKNIHKGEEILFDYDGQDALCNKYSWINDLDEEDITSRSKKSKISPGTYSAKNRREKSENKSTSHTHLFIKQKRNRHIIGIDEKEEEAEAQAKEDEIEAIQLSPDSLSLNEIKLEYDSQIRNDDTKAHCQIKRIKYR